MMFETYIRPIKYNNTFVMIFLILLFAPPPFSSGLGTGNGGVNKHITTQRPSRSSSDSPGLNRHSRTALGSGGQTYTLQHNETRHIYIFFYWLRSDSSSKTRLRISVGRSLGVGYPSSRFIPDKYLSLNSMSTTTTTTTTTTLNRTTLNPTFFSFCFLFLFTLIEHNKRNRKHQVRLTSYL